MQAKKVKKAVLSTTARARTKAQAKAAEKEKTSTGAPYMYAGLSRFPCRPEQSSALRHSCALVIYQTLVPLRRPTNACLVLVAESAAVLTDAKPTAADFSETSEKSETSQTFNVLQTACRRRRRHGHGRQASGCRG